ncbi:hypothetical protein CRYUN_Cryun37aG0111300 [Craigia yunnanensis]
MLMAFLHGFPEIVYLWRHQMVVVANAGFRAIAPDYRGYGLSDIPPEPENTTFACIVTDLVPILDHLGVNKSSCNATFMLESSGVVSILYLCNFVSCSISVTVGVD